MKQNAWNSLKNYYWPALGVTFVASILGANGGGGFSGGGSGVSNLSDSYSDSGSSGSDHGDIDAGAIIAIILIALVIFVVALAFSLAFQAFLGNVVRVGECKYFCDARNGDQSFGKLFDNFRNGNYMDTVKTMFFRSLYIMLWSLLFYIPGIIKAYEYYLIPYLLAENPHLDRNRAFEISKKTMDGEKWNLFVLGLSFIGWYLLGILACGVGTMFVVPYYEATMAEFYTCMRAKMLSFGYTTEEELTGGMGGFGATTYTAPNTFNNGPVNPNNNGPVDPYNSTPSNPYGAPANPYGAPAAPANPYGAPAAPANPYGAPAAPANPYGAPAAPAQENGAVSLDKAQTDMPGITQDAFGNPVGSNGFPDPAAPSDNRVSLDKPAGSSDDTNDQKNF
ncbi:MAG: DUF975 family protein [Oscillospiraceae bacterium]|nr:DUF975 family protein [Oscillospiraceae bacterium]